MAAIEVKGKMSLKKKKRKGSLELNAVERSTKVTEKICKM